MDLLDTSHGALQPPIRSEIFGLERFAQHGRSLGETHRVAKRTSWRITFFPRLQDNIRTLRSAHRYMATQAAAGYDISPAAEWLLDNFHLIEAQLKAVHEGLPRSYFRTLPVLMDEPLAGLPRVYGVAWAFVAHTDGAFNEALLCQYLTAYQETRELKLSEMWALPTTLRVVLIENLRRLAERLAAHKAARELANRCCDHLSSYSIEALDSLVAWLTPRGVDQIFLAQMAQRLNEGGAMPNARHDTAHAQWLQSVMPDLARVQSQQTADQTADNLSMSNAVTSLRAIGDADWPDIVSRTSTLMTQMLALPLFAAEHVGTRDLTLHAIERLARQSGRGELAVASALTALMAAATANPDSSQAEGSQARHWLEGPGRPALLRALHVPESRVFAWRAMWQRWTFPAYLGTLLLGTAALVAWLSWDHRGDWAWLGIVLMVFPASEAVIAVINRLVSESKQPHHLPRLALAAGIPIEHRVMVVIPSMLTNTTAIDELAHRLELHHLANPQAHAQFALLTDWADADTAHQQADDAFLAQASALVAQLNARHPASAPDAAPRFILLHRHRSFSESEQRWIGWERKRGKLEQLVAALFNDASPVFIDLGEASRIALRTRYIVTLDSDTQMPPGRLRELVSVAAHPDNQPRLDDSGRQVVSGYGILQPRVVTPLPAPKDFTRFHWLFAGQSGVDPYSAATSEVYQDLFAEGSFNGKGLLNVAAVQAVLAHRLPEGLILSHDLLEGSIARCATVTDITLIEEAPFHADVAASRVHRWTRGDWQLLPVLFGPIGQGMSGINRWKMLDNLRRSLVAPASLAWLLLTLAGVGISPWAALGLVIASLSAGPLMGAVAGFSPSRHAVARQRFYGQAAKELYRAVFGGLWLLAQLVQRAMLAIDAIARALHRMQVSHRHLLQWATSAAVQASARTDLASMAKAHWPECVLALALTIALQASGTHHPALALALGLAWTASPLWSWWVSRLRPLPTEAALSATDRLYLQGIARDTWRYFEHCVTEQDRHLPPDNFQTMPHDLLAHRTSPTNIGLYLLSVACARRFGWIGTDELLKRLEATMASLDTMQRYRGHFLNWYDTQTGEPLLPMYVSTVDSGNLSGHLLAVTQACLEITRLSGDAAPSVDQRARLLAMAAACEAMAWSADFSFLYHRKRHLFHLGYLVAAQQLDTGFYDLLASESRLTGLLAIARGDVPVNHWSLLGRPFYAMGTQVGLRSWSGSMFEYLMPSLILDEPHDSVLGEACRAALAEHIAFGKAQSIPWGISESAHAGQDHTLAYQYAPHGVPRLALRRTPPGELVVAPYATGLAAQISPYLACRNFQTLEAFGARGPLGFIEALDFSAIRPSSNEACTPVYTYMAHHQGMTIVALANVLLDGVAKRWGMANAHIEAVASVLHERSPREVSRLYEPPPAPTPSSKSVRSPGLLREVVPGMAAVPPTHLLSNGRYQVALRANGAGWSRWGQAGITRWRDDALRDAHGSFFYLRWPTGSTGGQALKPVSITQHPAPDPRADYQCTFQADRVSFTATWPEVQATTKVWVSAEDDIEFRQVELLNLGDEPLAIELMSAFDVTLSDPRADEAHPAFTNLFVRARWLAEQQALWFERMPRLATESGMLAAHFLADSDAQIIGMGHQTDRQQWLGRNHDASWPLAAFDAGQNPPSPHDSPPDTGLDPVCALSVRLRIAAHGKATLTFATTAGNDAATLRAIIDKYRQASHVQRASLMSATLNGIRMRALRITPETLSATQTLTTALLLSLTRPSSQPARLQSHADDVCDRRLLWRLSISGERPLILVSVSMMQGLGLLRSLGQALQVWSWGGVACDLVVINREPASYLMPVHREISTLSELQATLGSTPPLPGQSMNGSRVHLLRGEELSPDERHTLHSVARIHLHADGRPLLYHVQAWSELHEAALQQRHDVPACALARACAFTHAPASVGTFTPATGTFRFLVDLHLRPERPWINVLSNPGFGAQLSEAGGGYTWALNSRLNQLTAWSNDPVADSPSEWFLLQDCQSLDTWSISPSAWGVTTPDRADNHTGFQIAHGQGHSVISHCRGDLEISATWCVDPQTSVKQIQLSIVNRGEDAVELRLIGIVEWMMGANRTDRRTVHTALHRARGQSPRTVLLATQREQSGGFGQGTAFLSIDHASEDHHDQGPDWTCDRRECFDVRGRLMVPDRFGQQAGIGLDPCAALSTRLSLAGGASAERSFLMGYAPDAQAARKLADAAGLARPAHRLAQVRDHWRKLLGATTVSTPDPLFDAMVNHWLLYQSISCRLWAKAGFYQAGGATGFRDQLQDAMALAWAAPHMLRDQIVLCASRQFPEGDVQHWWHAPTGAGVRTHFSDDLLWLPHACVHHLRITGDATLLDEPVPFLEGNTIAEGAEDVYEVPRISEQHASVYEHAARAIDKSLRVGVHGLPLMGCGDWNDGMNRVGAQGRGESVWLGWFLCHLVADFAPLARSRGDEARAVTWESAARGWREALNGPAWDGQWFKRAFFDDGEALGSHLNPEARIDLIAQAWAVLSNAAPLTQQRLAMASVEQLLVDHEAGLIRLLDPPLAHAQPSAGYIQAYPPGVRENGGQYSHAGVWALMAQAELAKRDPQSLGGGDTVYRYFTYLSPAHRANHPVHRNSYAIEPYVIAGDVYSHAPYVGRGGWSWYSGAAAWLHRAAIESMFGLHLGPEILSLTPCLPSHWPQAEMSLQRDDLALRFILIRATAEHAMEDARATWAPDAAQLLLPGQALRWSSLSANTCLVVPLL